MEDAGFEFGSRWNEWILTGNHHGDIKQSSFKGCPRRALDCILSRGCALVYLDSGVPDKEIGFTGSQVNATVLTTLRNFFHLLPHSVGQRVPGVTFTRRCLASAMVINLD